MTLNSDINSIFALDEEELFRLAVESGAKRNKSYWSPIVFDAGCRTSPGWRSSEVNRFCSIK